MNLSELKKDTVYVNMRGFDEMVVLDTENLYTDMGFRIGVTTFNEPGTHVAVLHNVAGLSNDLVKLAKKVQFNGSSEGAAYKQPENGTSVRFVKPHEIAGERDAIREELKNRRNTRMSTADRFSALDEPILDLVPDKGQIADSPDMEVSINIEVLERLIALAQKGKEVQ